ncbi:MAG: hypothetical protein AAB263_20455 [Planctomycetota bacterium]
MASLPRVVVVTRATPLDMLLLRHGTLDQARFFLRSRGEDPHWHEEVHARQQQALGRVLSAIPAEQRRVRIDRDGLDRFLFAADDLVVVVGQDGLVPNVAKYLDGQLVIGVNPDPASYDGVLCRHPAFQAAALIAWAVDLSPGQGIRIESRAMAAVQREDGQRLLSLNEVFIGHRSHQSARYRLSVSGRDERQSSSGLILATGTGSTGWARSIARQRGVAALPKPEERRVSWFVREPFPSVSTGTELEFGLLGEGESLRVVSEMGDGGIVFADGMEADALDFPSGASVMLSLASERLNLMVPEKSPEVRKSGSPEVSRITTRR